ncbi:hypothetical protein MKZ38_007181 [Zalerion maritima]|uniref:SnoaL-like domain-containing protein n=1 Tax=Zalerion maritima TaxID=339359 RepID=A0AAD5WP99_9PEZI|nr:hypothetical protein MKZ38_007181 [Zalerion maritima]
MAKQTPTIESLQAQLGALEHQLARQDAVRQITNLMNEYVLLYEAGRYEERLSLVAQHTPGVVIEIGGRGVFRGLEGARRTLVDIEESFQLSHDRGMRRLFPEVEFPSPGAGKFESELLGVPVVEVAGDGRTARALWTTLQAVGKTHEQDPEPRAGWLWWRMGIDFVKEEADGRWRIWHMLRNPFFFAEYGRDWVDASLSMPPVPQPGTQKGLPGHEGEPDAPTTRLYDPYRITRELKLWPEPPSPYETFDMDDSYVG